MMTNIEISSPEKLIFPKDKIKKIDVINYYNEIADLMLPFVRKRLLSVIRCHDGIHGKCFFKKHPSSDKKMVKVRKVKDEEYFYIEDKFQLLYQVQMGTIEFHTWASCVPKINQPNMMVFDLDPDEKLRLKKLRDSVMKLKIVLDELKLPAYLTSTGQQKTVLIEMILAHAKLIHTKTNHRPLILLDEAAAHLDANARKKLFQELGNADAQVWATGLDPNIFEEVPDATFVTCKDGEINNIVSRG